MSVWVCVCVCPCVSVSKFLCVCVCVPVEGFTNDQAMEIMLLLQHLIISLGTSQKFIFIHILDTIRWIT